MYKVHEKENDVCPYLSYDIHKEFKSNWVMHQSISVKLTQKLSGTSFTVGGTEVRTHLVPVFHPPHSEGKGTPWKKEINLQLNMYNGNKVNEL